MYVVGSVGSFGAEYEVFISVDGISDAVVLMIGWKYADRKPLWFAIIRIEAINRNEIDQNEISIKKWISRRKRPVYGEIYYKLFITNWEVLNENRYEILKTTRAKLIEWNKN